MLHNIQNCTLDQWRGKAAQGETNEENNLIGSEEVKESPFDDAHMHARQQSSNLSGKQRRNNYD